MKDGRLDDLDRRIVYELQKDARHVSSSDIAEVAEVSASTVRNRIRKLEESGIIRGYDVDVDYEAAGYQLYTKIICTAPIERRGELAKQALEVPGVVAVREIMTGQKNVYVNAIGEDHDDLADVAQRLDALGLEMSDEQLIRDEYVGPYHGFGAESIEE